VKEVALALLVLLVLKVHQDALVLLVLRVQRVSKDVLGLLEKVDPWGLLDLEVNKE